MAVGPRQLNNMHAHVKIGFIFPKQGEISKKVLRKESTTQHKYKVGPYDRCKSSEITL